MRTLAVFLLLSACAGPRGEAGPTVRGEVVSVDAEPMTYDGDALVVVRTEAGARTVRIPARFGLCAATDVVDLLALRPGIRVEAQGEVNADGDVTPCASPDHYLRLVDG